MSPKVPATATPDEVVVHLERGSEVLFFNVYRFESVKGRVKPALGAGFTVGSKTGARSGSPSPVPSSAPSSAVP